MPLYEYLCDGGHRVEAFRPMAESAEDTICHCGATAKRVPSLVRVFGDYEGYESPVSGKWIEGKRARLEDLKRTGCRPYEEGEREQAVVRRAAEERELDRSIDESVERAAAELRIR